jgi:glucan 1,3-beta-glucosidase
VVNDTPVFVRSSNPSNGVLGASLVLNNIKLNNVPVVVGVVGGEVVLSGGAQATIKSWGQGNIYPGTNETGRFIQGDIAAAHKPSMLLDSAGRVFGKMHPQYADYSVSQFISVKDHGAKGDGGTDDTKIIQSILHKVIQLDTIPEPHIEVIIVCRSENNIF